MGSSFEIVFILLLTVLNGVFSMSETAIVSSRRARLQQRVNQGDTRAKVALELSISPDRFLSTVQIGITLIGILAGAFGGARLSQDLAKALQDIGLTASVSQNLGFGLVVAAITFLSLVIGELVPKRFALNNPEHIATSVAAPMNALARLTSPLVSLLTVSSNAVFWLLRIKPSSEPAVTEDEIKILIGQATHSGVFSEAEQEIVERVFRTADRRVTDLMTPRSEIVWLDKEASKETIRQQMSASHRSRFPVGEGSLDNIAGIVSLKDLWEKFDTEKIDWPSLLIEPLYIYESTRALEVLDRFRAVGQHIALVVDEYGVVSGLVTLHDIMEDMVGDVPTTEEPYDAAAVQREDGSWLLDGMLPKEEMQRLLKLGKLPQDAGYNTLSGFVMERLGRIPSVSDHFEYEGQRFEVVDMDGHRVDKVLVTPTDTHEAAHSQ